MHQIKTIDITQKTQTPFPLSIQVLNQTNNRKALIKIYKLSASRKTSPRTPLAVTLAPAPAP